MTTPLRWAVRRAQPLYQTTESTLGEVPCSNSYLLRPQGNIQKSRVCSLFVYLFEAVQLREHLAGSLVWDGASIKLQDPGEAGAEPSVPICPAMVLAADSSQSLG